LLFEIVKSNIRGKTIAYSTEKKKKIDKEEKLLENNIIYSPTKETVHGKNCYMFSTRWPIDTKFTDNILWHC
jgi:hypothetical protein